jgi:hypothetical protein
VEVEAMPEGSVAVANEDFVSGHRSIPLIQR